MTYPDFSNYGYQITQELGHNKAGGRVTYLATEINTNQTVVIKQFQFARVGANWREYDSYQKEIDILKRLEHLSIPSYLDSFQTPTGFCMIQEYKNALSLATTSSYKPEEIKQIALSTLEILSFLQNQIPPIIHRDLKPENILVDEYLKVSLVDFGFARLGSGEIAVSSIVKGTLGFMPPEQMFNRQLTPACDLYSLGMTLISLLTQTPSTEISSLIDENGKVDFKEKVPHLNKDFITWLEKMVEPQLKNRFANARTALDALILIPVLAPVVNSFEGKYIKWAMVGGLAVVLALGIGGIIKSTRLVEPIITNNPRSLTSLDKVSLADNKVYFKVKLPLNRTPIKNPNISLDNVLFKTSTAHYNNIINSPAVGTCQLYDSLNRLVATGVSKLIAAEEESTSWCSYAFLGNDRAGNWTFKFYVDGELVSRKRFLVF